MFQGPYQIVHVATDEQLLYLSAYIHRNPIEISTYGHSVSISDRYEKYQWSSCQDYIGKNRWDNLLARNIVLEQFADQSAYREYMQTHTAKNAGLQESSQTSLYL